ncbi:MAG: AraC family transcriptional regulator [Leptospirales bacterium]
MSGEFQAVGKHLFLLPDGACFRGAVEDNQPHRHHALQIVLSPEEFRLTCAGREIHTRCILIASDLEHALHGRHPGQRLFLIAPDSATGEFLRDRFLKTDRHYIPETETLESAEIDLSISEPDCAAARRERETILRNVFKSGRGIHPAGDEGDDRVKRVRHWIEARGEFQISLADAADHTGLSPDRLRHLFKQVTGISFRRYVMWSRIRRAVAAAASGVSLTDAAHQAGFADQAHFSRSFRDMFGLSPRDSLSEARSVGVSICFV